jgi:hypothetical protein
LSGIKIRCLTTWLRPKTPSDCPPMDRRLAEHSGAIPADQ